MLLGAHIHHIEVMAPQSATVPGVDVVQVVMPAISPVYGNNPGFGLLKINPSNQSIEEMTFKFFQLEDYYRMELALWREIDVQKTFDIDLNDPSSVRDYNTKMQLDFQQFAMQQAYKFGVPKYLAQGAAFFWSLYQMFDSSQSLSQIGTVCTLQSFDQNSLSDPCKQALGL